MKNKIIVWHEYGAEQHYKGLNRYAKDKDLVIIYREFDLLKQSIKLFLLRQDFKVFIKNLIFPFRLLFVRQTTIVLGMAPGDFRLFLYYHLLKRHKLIWHTSWVRNGVDENLPRGFQFIDYKLFWYKKMKDISSSVAIVNPLAYPALKQIGFTNIVSVFHTIQSAPHVKKISKKQLVGFVGRPVIAKGYNLFVELSEQIHNHNISFFQCGIKPEKKLKNDKIINLGYLDKSKLLKKLLESKIIINMSKSKKHWEEVFGISIVEAIITGNYILCTRSPGTIFLKRVYTNFIFFIDNNKKLSEQLNELMQNREVKSLPKNYFSSLTISKRWKRVLS